MEITLSRRRCPFFPAGCFDQRDIEEKVREKRGEKGFIDEKCGVYALKIKDRVRGKNVILGEVYLATKLYNVLVLICVLWFCFGICAVQLVSILAQVQQAYQKRKPKRNEND